MSSIILLAKSSSRLESGLIQVAGVSHYYNGVKVKEQTVTQNVFPCKQLRAVVPAMACLFPVLV